MNMFNRIKIERPKRNKFDLSHEKKLSCNMGELVPILCQEVVPGDKFQVNTEIMIRLAPMLAPVMHRINVFTHYFFVPNRIVWDNWETFITGGEQGTSTPLYPFCGQAAADKDNIFPGTLPDYMGIPAIPAADVLNHQINFSSLPFRGYQTIYNEYYRDQNLTTAIAVDTSVDGQESAANRDIYVTMRQRAWEKDYFTSALPFSQRGLISEVPITFVPVTGKPALAWDVVASPPVISSVGTPNVDITALGQILGADSGAGRKLTAVDVSDSLQITITDLRNAVRLQEWLEKNARGGSRYVEQILSHFGVRSSDARLQRPEYLGGGKSNIVISEVLQTSETATTPQGNLGGHGLGVGKSNTFNKFFEEHGFIIGIMSVLPRTAYQQGLHRQWTKFDKFDHYWPEFAHIGEQIVLQGEINHKYTGGSATNTDTFGYQSRYAEYKYGCDMVHGDFRDTLDFWHMGRIFAADPTLNTSFVESSPTHRIFANTTPTDDKLWIQLYNRISALRPMPYFSDPKF